MASYGAVEAEPLLEGKAWAVEGKAWEREERDSRTTPPRAVMAAVGVLAAAVVVYGRWTARFKGGTINAPLHHRLSHHHDRREGEIKGVFYINCDFSPDRRALQEAQLSSWGVPYERFECVTGDTVDEVLDYSAFTRQFRDLPVRSEELSIPGEPLTIAHSIACGFSHWSMYDKIANIGGDPDALYLVLEDDAVLSADTTLADVEAAARNLPDGWEYASLNVHEAYCKEDFVNDDWLVKSGDPLGPLIDDWRVEAGQCTPVTLDFEWGGKVKFLYLSAAASLVRPRTARKILEWLTSMPIFHIDASLRTPSTEAFASYQSAVNFFEVTTAVSEARITGSRQRKTITPPAITTPGTAT